MNRFQKVRFTGIQDFLDFLPQEELVIVEALRKIIAASFPIYTERLAYNVPFYYHRSRICFIWPSAVPWGNLKEGVALGFCRANKLVGSKELLQIEETKTISRKIIHDVNELDEAYRAELRFLLQEAYLLDMSKKK
ncbi:MAG: DUF1801 domain-containing protein [Bacteroidota bacterium]